MLPPRTWEVFESMGADVPPSSPRLFWKKKVCWCLAFEILGLYPQTQGETGRASVQENGPIAASSRLTSEVKFLRVSLGVSQPLQGLTWAGTGRRASAAGWEERGAYKLQPETLPGGSRGKNKFDCTWCPCSAALQSTERETSRAWWPNVTSFCRSVCSHMLEPSVRRGTLGAPPPPAQVTLPPPELGCNRGGTDAFFPLRHPCPHSTQSCICFSCIPLHPFMGDSSHTQG